MTDKTTQIERFKNATAAALRAVAGKKLLEVTYAAGETADRPSPADDIRTRLPVPDAKLSAHERALMRGSADAKALRLKHHDKSFHRRNAPLDLSAATVFDALEQARVEAIGADQMTGVGKNLHTLLDEKAKRLNLNTIDVREDSNAADAVHILARMALTGEDAPQHAGKLVDLWKPWVESKLGKGGLDTLKPLIHDQKAFAKKAKEFMAALDMLADGSDRPDDTQQDNPDDQKPADQADSDDAQDQQDGQPEGGEQDMDSADDSDLSESDSGMDGESRSDESYTDDYDGEAPGEQRNTRDDEFTDGHGGKYTIYTTAFDEIVDADDLADAGELTRLRHMLDQQLTNVQGVVGKLAHRLQRKLMARQQRRWQFDMEEGYIDSARLARVVANPTVPLSFKQEKETDFRDTVVTLLIDNSGSMRGRPIAIAALCTDIIAQTLERCGVKVEILGFTTRAWKGGKSRDLWITNGRPAHPGRLNDIRHIIYKSADAPLRRTRKNLGLMLKEGILKENIDGEALVWAHNRLARRPEQRKILMVISDGAPVDDSTLSVNPNNILERDLRTVIAWIEGLRQVQLSAIGIGHDVTRYYSRAMTIADADELAGALIERLESLFHLNEKRSSRSSRA
jgi:cobaltochelatase CobT